MKNEMKDEDLAKVSGGWSITRFSGGDISIQFLTGPQMEALSNLSEELGLDWGFTEDSCVFDVGSLDEVWDLPCRRCNIYNKDFNKEIFERIKQVIGEPEEVSL